MFPVIPITDQIFLPTYITIISLIYTLSLFWLLKRSKQYGFSARVALDSAFAVMIGGFVGARLFHVFYEAFDYYQQDWMRVFYIWHGGFVFYGGAIGALIAVYFYTRISRIHFMDLADMYAIVFSVGYGFGRIACFLNGC